MKSILECDSCFFEQIFSEKKRVDLSIEVARQKDYERFHPQFGHEKDKICCECLILCAIMSQFWW